MSIVKTKLLKKLKSDSLGTCMQFQQMIIPFSSIKCSNLCLGEGGLWWAPRGEGGRRDGGYGGLPPGL